jgi:hypothetical protein
MRTTVTLDDDAFLMAQAYATARGLWLGQAVSELIHLGTAIPMPVRRKNGAWVFDPPPDAPRVTARQVQALEGHL